MNRSTIEFLVKTLGADEAARELGKIESAAKRAGTTVKQYLNTAAGESKLIDLQKRGAIARVEQAEAAKQQAFATNQAAGATDRAGRSQAGYFAHIAKTTVQSALINKLFLEFVDVSGQAIKQVDLMQNFPATMASMGQSTGDASVAMDTLRNYIGQVGGNLGDATSYVTRFTGAVGNVKAATAVFVGLNNALIAGDSTLEEQRQAAIQFAQALERGKPELREWRTLTQNMSFQLGMVAESMGYVNANELGEALSQGKESMAAFTTELTKMATGTGPIAEQAMVRMNGMQFSFNVLKNTMVQGLAAIIDAIGRQNIVSFFSFLTQVIQVLASAVVKLIGALVTLLNLFGSLFGLPAIKLKKDVEGIADGIGAGAGNAEDLAGGLGDAGKEAKKLNKTLAGFDKMNVLPEKESGGGGGAGGGAGGAGFDAGQMGDLGNLFGDIGGGLKEASEWAKIFAGILGALAANKLIEKIFGVSPLKLFAKALGTYVLAPLGRLALQGGAIAGKFGISLARGLLGLGSGGSGVMGSAAALGAKIGLAISGGISTGITAIGGVVSKIPGILGNALSKVPALLSRLAGGWVGALGRALLSGLAAVGSAIVGAIGAVAAALGIPFAAAAALVAAVVAAIVAIIWVIWTNWEAIWGFISGVAVGFWNWLVGAWTALVDILSGPFQIMWQIVSSIFILIVALVAITLETIYNILVGIGTWVYNNVITPVWKFFVWLWNTIVEGTKTMWDGMIAVLVTIGTWIYDNVITPIVDFFVGLWNGIVDLAKAWWQGLMEIFIPIATWVNMNIITPITNFFRGLWDGIKNMVSEFITAFKNFFAPIATWIKTNVIDRIAGFFTGLWDGIVSGVKGVISGIESVMGTIVGLVKAPINGVIDLINGVLYGINKIKVPDWVPGLGGKSPNFPKIPKLAKGGIVSRSTLIEAGEAGAEAIVPLENNTGAIEKIAALLNSAGGNGRPVQLVVQIGEEQIANKVIDLINEKTQMSGRNAIYV